jgi:hypothetical protein
LTRTYFIPDQVWPAMLICEVWFKKLMTGSSQSAWSVLVS